MSEGAGGVDVPKALFYRNHPRAGQTKNTQNLGWHGRITKNAMIRGDEQNRHLVVLFYKPIAFLFCLSLN